MNKIKRPLITIAIVIGVAFAMILFIKSCITINVSTSKVENSKLTYSDSDVESTNKGTTVAYITGMLFFANIDRLKELLNEVHPEDTLILSMRGVAGLDMGGAKGLIEIIEDYRKENTQVLLCGLNDKVKETLLRTDVDNTVDENCIFWSVDRALLR